jgi:PAS domain S-box-containing protein
VKHLFKKEVSVMEYVRLAVICAAAATVSLVFVYGYLYMVYRERFMKLWFVSWIGFAVRLVFFDSGIFDWNHEIWAFIGFQILYIGTILPVLLGTHLLLNQSMWRGWLGGAIFIFTLTVVLQLAHWPLIYQHIFSEGFAGIALLFIGRSILLRLQTSGVGKQITGYSFILWGIITILSPCAVSLGSNPLICGRYIIGGILRLLIASGTLIIYLEKSRTDISQLEAARADLAKKEAQYRLLAENAVDVIYRYRLFPDAGFDYISPSALAITGYGQEEYYRDSKLARRIIHRQDRTLFKNFLRNPLLYVNFPLTLRLIRKDKSPIWIEGKTVPAYDESGRLSVIEGIVRDVTERKKYEQIAIRAEKVNIAGKMVINVADQIRDPLTTVRGYMQMMARKKELFRHRPRFDLMIAELDKANAILGEYLFLAKDRKVERRYCSLNDIINALYPLIYASAFIAKVNVAVELRKIPRLCVDEAEIRQLILNMIKNGIEAMPKGGRLIIATSVENRKIKLSIKDQGEGIAPHVLGNIGTPFFTTKDNGTGLGLAICYKIASRHDAVIDVATGKQGTTFSVYFNHLHIV